MDPSDSEFIAEKKDIEIIPNFTHGGLIHLISGDFGPFRAGLPVTVPIWLALHLKQRNKCRILSPTWMDVETLKELKEKESSSRFFIKMPSEHYMEIARMLLHTASDDIDHADEIRAAVKDLWEIRISKLRSSVDTFITSGGVHASLNHLTQLEINTIRTILPDGLDALRSIQHNSESEEEEPYENHNITRDTDTDSSLQL